MRTILSLFAFSSSLAFAQAPNSYTVNVSRVQGSFQCALSKLNGGSYDCKLHVAGQGIVTVTMDPKVNQAGDLKGYVGRDKVTEAGRNYVLVLGADANANLAAVHLITDHTDDTGNLVHATLAAVATGATHATNILPFTVDKTDPDCIVVTAAFVVYGAPSDNLVKPNFRADLLKHLQATMDPYLSTLQ